MLPKKIQTSLMSNTDSDKINNDYNLKQPIVPSPQTIFQIISKKSLSNFSIGNRVMYKRGSDGKYS